MADNGTEEMGLAKFLAQVRMEIDAAQRHLAASGKAAVLDWTEAELEISFEVKREIDAKGEVKFYIFAVEAGGKYSSEQVHKLKLKLKPSAGSEVAIAE